VRDAIVIGAGVSGLACARRLHDAGADVVVLEARDRIGGRVWTHSFDGGEQVELGALFVHGERASIVPVIERAGLTFASREWSPPQVLTVVDGRAEPADAVLDRHGFWSVEQDVAALNAPDVSLASALEAAGWPPERKRLAADFFREVWCADPDRLSAQGVTRVERAWTSGQANLVVAEGYARFPAFLARGLDVELSAPAAVVRWSRGGAGVRTSDGRVFEGRSVVVTTPPSVVASGALAFEPELPPAKRAAAVAIPVGPLLRVAVHLEDAAPSDVFVFREGGGWWTGRRDSRVLTGWIGGPPAADVSGRSAHALLDDVRPALPWLRSDGVADAIVADWGSDPWSRGGYSYPAVGALDAPGVWGAPVDDTLFFAGEATCGDVHPQTVHGAYESGLRAADEITATVGATGAREAAR
jgi:monoamine oxidase